MGYSRLTGADEVGTLAALKALTAATSLRVVNWQIAVADKVIARAKQDGAEQ